MSDWQPIETAPPLTFVLVADGDDNVSIASLDRHGDWVSDEGTVISYPLTHWMPVPDPPVRLPPEG